MKNNQARRMGVQGLWGTKLKVVCAEQFYFWTPGQFLAKKKKGFDYFVREIRSEKVLRQII